MFQYATIRESFGVFSQGDNQGAVDMVRRELCQLGALMLMDAVTMCEIQLIADEKEYVFSGTRPTDVYYSIVHAMGESQMISLDTKYRYVCANGFAEVPPIMMNNYIESLDDGLPNGIAYSSYHLIDGDSNLETLIAKGRQKIRINRT